MPLLSHVMILRILFLNLKCIGFWFFLDLGGQSIGLCIPISSPYAQGLGLQSFICTLASPKASLNKKQRKQTNKQRYSYTGTAIPRSKILICCKPFFFLLQQIKHLKWLAFVTKANGERFHRESSQFNFQGREKERERGWGKCSDCVCSHKKSISRVLCCCFFFFFKSPLFCIYSHRQAMRRSGLEL